MEATDPAIADTEESSGVTHALRRVIDEVEQVLRSAAVSGDEKFQAVRDRLGEQVREMRVQLAELEAAGLQKARAAARATDESVHAHPYAAMAVAGVAGILIGLLAARR
jgi:ElaB/YqjD/DUF883 family membrane-anchored ribosome-binding protein